MASKSIGHSLLLGPRLYQLILAKSHHFLVPSLQVVQHSRVKRDVPQRIFYQLFLLGCHFIHLLVCLLLLLLFIFLFLQVFLEVLAENEADVAAQEGDAIFIKEHSMFEPISGFSIG